MDKGTVSKKPNPAVLIGGVVLVLLICGIMGYFLIDDSGEDQYYYYIDFDKTYVQSNLSDFKTKFKDDVKTLLDDDDVKIEDINILDDSVLKNKNNKYALYFNINNGDYDKEKVSTKIISGANFPTSGMNVDTIYFYEGPSSSSDCGDYDESKCSPGQSKRDNPSTFICAGDNCVKEECCVDGTPDVVDCVETGNTAADCTADCGVVLATVTTAASGGGEPCVGDYTCNQGDGGCIDGSPTICDQPTNAGYDFANKTGSAEYGDEFSITGIGCATGTHEGTAVASSCASGGGEYIVTGCTPLTPAGGGGATCIGTINDIAKSNYNTSTCRNVQPGNTCTITCKSDPALQYTFSCPEGATSGTFLTPPDRFIDNCNAVGATNVGTDTPVTPLPCPDGLFRTAGGVGSADTCTACNPVTNAMPGTTTCTSATDSTATSCQDGWTGNSCDSPLYQTPDTTHDAHASVSTTILLSKCLQQSAFPELEFTAFFDNQKYINNTDQCNVDTYGPRSGGSGICNGLPDINNTSDYQSIITYFTMDDHQLQDKMCNCYAPTCNTPSAVVGSTPVTPTPPPPASGATLCAADYRVESNACVDCPLGTTNAVNDDASGNDTRCDNINECDDGPCMNGGVCVDGDNAYACTCVGGYTGLTCADPPVTVPDDGPACYCRDGHGVGSGDWCVNDAYSSGSGFGASNCTSIDNETDCNDYTATDHNTPYSICEWRVCNDADRAAGDCFANIGESCGKQNNDNNNLKNLLNMNNTHKNLLFVLLLIVVIFLLFKDKK